MVDIIGECVRKMSGLILLATSQNKHVSDILFLIQERAHTFSHVSVNHVRCYHCKREGEKNPCRELDEGKLANCILIGWRRPSMHLLTWHDAHHHYNKWKGHLSSMWEKSVHHYELM